MRRGWSDTTPGMLGMQRFWLMLGMALVVAAAPAMARDGSGVVGRWLTQDKKGVVAITRCGTSICGRLDWLYKPLVDGKPARDTHNPNPARRGDPLCGLTMLYDFHRDTDNPRRWVDGYIYDPESGDVYHAQITPVDPDHLRLRGYVGIPLFGESQIWTRAGPSKPACHVG